MRRSFASLLVLSSVILAGCGGGGGPASTARAEQSAGDPASDTGHEAHGGEGEVAEGGRSVEVVGTSFAFDPPTIEAGIGEDLVVELTSEDAEHDFTIDELDAHTAARAGESATGGFDTGDRPGGYTFYCSVPGHREAGMEGILVVG